MALPTAKVVAVRACARAVSSQPTHAHTHAHLISCLLLGLPAPATMPCGPTH
jgi:hypothetical protein